MSRFQFNPHPIYGVIAMPVQGWPAWISAETPTKTLQVPNELTSSSAASNTPQRIHDVRTAIGKATLPKGHMQWVFSSFLLNTWIQEVPQGIASLAELSALVKLRAQLLFGAPMEEQLWAVNADWQSEGHMLCHAMPQVTLDALKNQAASSLLTLALAALKSIARNDASVRWYAVSAADELHVLAMRNGAPLTLRSTRRFAGATPEDQMTQVSALWHREKAKTDWELGKLHWLHCDSQLPPQHPAYSDVEWITPTTPSIAVRGQLSELSEAERMAQAAWTLMDFGHAR